MNAMVMRARIKRVRAERRLLWRCRHCNGVYRHVLGMGFFCSYACVNLHYAMMRREGRMAA